MITLSILPDNASFFKFLLIIIIVTVGFHFLFFFSRFILFTIFSRKDSDDSPPFLILFFVLEFVLLANLLVSIARYYSFESNIWMKILFYCFAWGCYISEIIRNDRRMENQYTTVAAMAASGLFLVFIFWNWFRELSVLSFPFKLLIQ